jgi:hypothetical protein
VLADASSPSDAICAALRRCSKGWSTPSSRWRANTHGCGRPRRATGCCFRSPPRPSSSSTVRACG